MYKKKKQNKTKQNRIKKITNRRRRAVYGWLDALSWFIDKRVTRYTYTEVKKLQRELDRNRRPRVFSSCHYITTPADHVDSQSIARCV